MGDTTVFSINDDNGPSDGLEIELFHYALYLSSSGLLLPNGMAPVCDLHLHLHLSAWSLPICVPSPSWLGDH